MTVIPQANRRAQLPLFDEQRLTPNWNDLTEAMRHEAVRLLAQLLINVRVSHLGCVPYEQGGQHD